jgi:hypothetical protein
VSLLTAEQFKATMEPRPVRVDPEEAPPFDFWPYFDAIPPADFAGFDFSEGLVTNAWTMPTLGLQHVLVRCDVANVFLVLVLDLDARQVRGHHILDLNDLYGVAS